MASPETINPTDDGWAGNQSPDNQTWATIRAANGGIKRGQADTDSESLILRNGSTSGWNIMRRGQFVVASTLIPVSATITAAKLRLYVSAKTTNIPSQAITLCNGGPAGTSIVASDYEGNVSNTTVWGDSVTLASITTSQYNEWNFNAAGLAGLQAQLGSNFKFQLRFESERANSEPGSFSANRDASMTWNFGNNASNKSELVITYTTPVLGKAIFFL